MKMEMNLLIFGIKITIFSLIISNNLSVIIEYNNSYTENLLNTNFNNYTRTTVKTIASTKFKKDPPTTNDTTQTETTNYYTLMNLQRVKHSTDNAFDESELGRSNINEEVDMALKTIWPFFIEHGYTTLLLPDLADIISIKPLLITYLAELRLTNGHLFNIQGIQRFDDAYMTYLNKLFQFRLNIVISSQQFVYDFAASVIGIEISGTVNGVLKNTLVAGDFSVRAIDANVKLNDFRIISFGNIKVSITHNRIIREISSMILSPITKFLEDRITTTISDAICLQLEHLMDDINKDDTLELKKFLNLTLSGIVG